MKLCFDISWSTSTLKKGPDGSMFHINTFVPDADWVIDLSSRIFSPLASKYPPSKRIFVAGEPSPYMSFNPEKIRRFGEFYQGCILSWHKELRGFPQTRLFRMGTSWVAWPSSPSDKKFGIGGIFSAKNNPALPGYAIRRRLIDLQGKISIPNMIYHPGGSWNGVSYKFPYPTKKDSLDFMFHLAVENCSEEGYFSEKVMDCFLSHSIPVYYGDPTIGDIFNTNGIIVLDVSNPLPQINSLTPELYASRIPAVLNNRNRATPYCDLEYNIYYHIKKYLGDKK